MKSQTLLFTIAFLFFTSCNNQQNKQAKEDAIKASLNTFVETCWNKKELAVLKSITTDDVVRKVNGVTVSSNQNELEASIRVFFKGFPDLLITNPNIYIKNNKAFVDFIFSGTNIGVFAESPATGKKVKVSGFSIMHFNEDGKMVLEEVHYNELDLLQQLGYTLIAPVVE